MNFKSLFVTGLLALTTIVPTAEAGVRYSYDELVKDVDHST